MRKENVSTNQKIKWKTMRTASTPGVIYSLGFVGAVFYFIQHATSIWMGFFGIVKAIFWPALLVYKALELLKM